MKLMIRCKLGFHARGMIIDVLRSVVEYELKAIQLKEELDK